MCEISYKVIIPPVFMPRGTYMCNFHLSDGPFVCSFVSPFVELLQSFTLKLLKWVISHQPLIRKHSFLDHRYPGGSAFIPWLLTLGSMMPWGGARGQNLGLMSISELKILDDYHSIQMLKRSFHLGTISEVMCEISYKFILANCLETLSLLKSISELKYLLNIIAFRCWTDLFI